MPVADQGLHHRRYTVVPRTLIFLRRGTQVLLIRGAAHKRLWADLYNGLGGHIEPGESALKAAQRELEEEAGLNCVNLYLSGVLNIDANTNQGVVVFIFSGDLEHGEPRPSPEGLPEWIEPDTLSTRPLVEDLYILLPRVLAQRESDQPFFAHSYYDADGKLHIEIDS